MMQKNENLDLQKKNYQVLTEKTKLESELQRAMNEVKRSDDDHSKLFPLQQKIIERET